MKKNFGVNIENEYKEDLDKISKLFNCSRSQVIANLVSAIKRKDVNLLKVYEEILNNKGE